MNLSDIFEEINLLISWFILGLTIRKLIEETTQTDRRTITLWEANMKVLAIFDNETKDNEISKILNGQNLEVISAGSLSEAYGIIANDSSFALIVACAKILKNHGTELLGYLRSDRKLRWIPIIATCMDCELNLLMKLLREGVSDIIVYPFIKEVVSAKVARAILNGKRRIMIIDDEPCILDILQTVFELEGYNVLQFSTADEAAKYLETNDVHAIISDIMLPGMNGVDLLQLVKSKYPHIPIILITGHSGKYTPDMVISMGADGYFKKPFHNMELAATLEAVIMRYKGVNKEVPVEAG